MILTLFTASDLFHKWPSYIICPTARALFVQMSETCQNEQGENVVPETEDW